MSVFDISTISNKGAFLGVSFLVLLVPVLLIAACVYFYFGVTSASVKLNVDELVIDAVFYGRAVKRSSIDYDGVFCIADRERFEWPILKVNGIALSGLKWGWFQGGGRRLLIFSAAPENAVFIPTKENFDIIISLDECHSFIDQLNSKEGK